METNNVEGTSIFSGNLVESFKENWMNIVIIIAVLIILLIIITVTRRRLSGFFVKKIPDEKILLRKRTLTFNSVISNMVTIIVLIAAVLVIADQLGISVTPLLAGAGVAGVVIGFGAQSLIKDIINGIFILLEQWYQVDDIVTAGTITGTVERFNLRTTVIRDLEGTVHYIPNGEITILGNRTQKWSRAVVDIAVSYNEDTDRVAGVLEEVFDDMVSDQKYGKLILERPVILGDGGVSELGDSAVIFKIICKVEAGEQWTMERQLKKRIKDKFEEAHIEIPYPCTNIYMRDTGKIDKEGDR
ncbi:MAG: mechanosensitive ion channel family protein [Actinobacteria bacterium]|nr:mechanosensitive ion channel family protein [Actinomycetota bacterium]